MASDVVDRVLEAGHVRRHVAIRVRDGRTNAGASGQVEHDIRPRAVEGGGKRVGIGGGRLDELEPRLRLCSVQVAQLPRPGIEVVERVDRDDVPAVGEETLDKGAADESGAAGDERARHGQLGIGADRPTPL